MMTPCARDLRFLKPRAGGLCEPIVNTIWNLLRLNNLVGGGGWWLSY